MDLSVKPQYSSAAAGGSADTVGRAQAACRIMQLPYPSSATDAIAF